VTNYLAFSFRKQRRSAHHLSDRRTGFDLRLAMCQLFRARIVPRSWY